MRVWKRRMILLLGAAALAVGAATGVDTYDERSCRGDVRVLGNGLPGGSTGWFGRCEGFLPW